MRLIGAVTAAEAISKAHNIPLADLVDTFATIPTVDAEPVVYGRIESNGVCSECGYSIPTDNRLDYIDKSEVRYCYYCGAKMEDTP